MGLLSDFLGKTGKKQAAATAEYNRGQNQSGYDAKMGYAKDAYGLATGRLDPYAQQGMADQGVYRNALGLNGAAGRQSALGMYEGSNPYLSGDVNRAQMLGDRRAAATGQFNSGMNALARARVGAEMGTQDWNNWMNRVGSLGQHGYVAANALAGLDQDYGNQRIGIEDAYRTGNMGIQSQYAKDYSQAATAGMNNIMGLSGLALQAATAGMGMPPTGMNFFGSNAAASAVRPASMTAGVYNPGSYAGYGLYQ